MNKHTGYYTENVHKTQVIYKYFALSRITPNPHRTPQLPASHSGIAVCVRFLRNYYFREICIISMQCIVAENASQ